MTFTDAVRTCFRKYFTFSGRASRPEYWWFMLFLFLGSMVAELLDSILFGIGKMTEERVGTSELFRGRDPIAGLFSIATFIPLIAAGWRRMHDTGRSGLYLLYPLIVLIGMGILASMFGVFDAAGSTGDAFMLVLLMSGFVFLISPLLVLWWLTRPSEPGANRFGPNPHRAEAEPA